MPKISFVMITARTDYPYETRRSDGKQWNIFEPTLKCFLNQKMQDFEWVIIDCLYDQRPDYFKEMELPFTVKHIPAKPNLWYEKGLPGITRQYNKGIIYADGEILFFTGEGYMMRPDFMENIWKHYVQGYFSLAWYMRDYGSTDPNFAQYAKQLPHHGVIEPPRVLIDGSRNPGKEIPDVTQTPVPYDMCGYKGERVAVEHRYYRALDGTRTSAQMPWDWWFGCSSASLRAMLKINGFDQNFDPDRMLLDVDVGSRLGLAGYGKQLAMFKNVFLVRIPSKHEVWNPQLRKDSVSIKCNYPLIFHSRICNKLRANTDRLSDQDVEWIKKCWCAKMCSIRSQCKENHPWQYPFEHKEGYPNHNSSKKWFEFWMEHQELVDLEEERELRMDADPKYREGTFIWSI